MLTAGEIINAALRFHGNVGEGTSTLDDDSERRALYAFRLRQTMAKAHTLAPYWWRVADGEVSLTASTNWGLLPADFGHFGEGGHPYINGQNYPPLGYVPHDEFDALEQTSSAEGPVPTVYTLKGTNAVGRKKILVYPTPSASMTLDIKSYVKRVPFPVDRPGPPSAVDAAVSGNLTGAYTWKVAYVWSEGETEPSTASTSLTLSSSKATVTIPVSSERGVTQRKLYRTAAGGTSWLLVATISDNTTTSYTDNIADGSLGAAALTASEAATGVEAFPEDFHENVLVEGLIYRIMSGQGDLRDGGFAAEWMAEVRRMWAEQRLGQNEPEAFPPYGSGSAPIARRWRLLS